MSQAEKTSKPPTSSQGQSSKTHPSEEGFVEDHSEIGTLQRKWQGMADESPHVVQMKTYQDMADQASSSVGFQGQENNTGLPDNLKSGIESLSGYSMDDVQVHFNSSKPAKLHAHAYTQGSKIHLGPGQERHLAHEAWHVVQQKQGRVGTTSQTSNGTRFNNHPALETEANLMGNRAASLASPLKRHSSLKHGHHRIGVIQRMIRQMPPEEFANFDEAETYVRYTIINNRNQTFEQAVEQYHGKGADFLRKRLWTILESIDKKSGYLSGIHKIVLFIIDQMNTEQLKAPDHPNRVWSSKNKMNQALEHESYATISQTKESIELARAIQKDIYNLDILGNGERPKFMLGVLVLPNKQLVVGVSGRLNRKVWLGQKLSKKYKLLGGRIYDANDVTREDYQAYEREVDLHIGHQHGKIKRKGNRVVRERFQSERDKQYYRNNDIGSLIAYCAAAVVISVGKNLHQSNFKRTKKSAQMGLTEVWLTNNPKKSSVLVSNSITGSGKRFNYDDDDVASCIVCQMQLATVAKILVKKDRTGMIKMMQTQIEARNSKVNKMKKHKDALDQLVNDLKEQKGTDESKSKFKQTITDLLEKKDKLNDEWEEANQEIKNLSRGLRKIENEIKDLEDVLNNSKFANLKRKIQAEDKLLEEMRALPTQIEQLETIIARLDSYKARLDNARLDRAIYSVWSTLVWTVQTRPVVMDEIRTNYQGLANVTNDNFDNRLQAELTTKRAELRALNQRNEFLRRHKDKIEKAKLENIDLSVEEASLEMDKEKLEATYKEKEAAFLEKKAKFDEYDELVESELEKLKQGIDEADQSLSDMKNAGIQYDRQSVQLKKQMARIDKFEALTDRLKKTRDITVFGKRKLGQNVLGQNEQGQPSFT